MDGADTTIRMARSRDADAFAAYLVEHVGESGRDGAAHFATSRSVSRHEARDAALARWDRPLDEPLWGRAFLLVRAVGTPSASPAVFGHVELRGGRVRAELHRATLGMGMLRAFTGKGHGAALLERAIAWARDEAQLDWIDLGVFGGNQPAHKLYARFGFVEIGRRRGGTRRDDGVSLEDIQMSLSLRDDAR